LNSPRATELSVYVVRALVGLRRVLLSNRELTVKVPQLERKVSTHERNIAELADSIGQLLAAQAPAPKRSIGFLPVEEKKVKPASKATRRRLAGRFKAAICDLKGPTWTQACDHLS
jgi:hypothetical protein